MKRLLLLAATATCLGASAVAEITIDFGASAGRIKPLHGVNNAPIRIGGDQREFRQAGIPSVRLHDACGSWGGTHYVDIPNIFPDFEADENDPKSYDFAFTDAFLKPIVAAGSDIFYRLGVTIETRGSIRAYNIYPPKDFAKWARVCEHVVRHYNEGWANGFKWNIVYWEVWNEPESRAMWRGTRQQFYDLYGTVARHLKACFPNIKVGGYGSCGFYLTDDPQNLEGHFAGDTRLMETFIPWFRDFCAYVTAPATRAPLDFFTWHYYRSNEVVQPQRLAGHARFVRETLDGFGLAKTESILDEWNSTAHGFEGMKTMPGASFCADMFCQLQAASVDMAHYYDALPQRAYCGLFRFPSQETTPTYEAFRAWNELYRLGGSAKVDCAEAHFNAAAATDGKAFAVLLVNTRERFYRDRNRVVAPQVKGVPPGTVFTRYVLDGQHPRLEPVGTWRSGESIEIGSLGVTLLATDFKGPRQLILAGDSTLAPRPADSSNGSWGDCLAPFLRPDVAIDNLAVSGRSSRSYRAEGKWKDLLTHVRKDDWVLVQFGINDLADDPQRATSDAAFRTNMTAFVDEVRQRGGRPILVSTTAFLKLTAEGRHAGNPALERRNAITREVAAEKGVPFVDLYARIVEAINAAGPVPATAWYLKCRNGVDDCHPARLGAAHFAKLFVEEARRRNLPFVEELFGRGK